MITAEQFLSATGRDPVGDDLERCNCQQGGEIGHYFCGWDAEANLPVFMVDPSLKLHAEVNRCRTVTTRERNEAGRPRNFFEPPFMNMIDSGTFWRCFHGVTRFAEADCPECRKEWEANHSQQGR